MLLGKKWHQDERLHVPGEHLVTLAEHVIIRYETEEFHTKLDAHLRVVERHYLGPLRVNLEGFRDDQNDSIITKELRTDFVDPSRIERGEMPGWTEVPAKDDLAIQVMFAMGYVDALPETPEEFHKMHGNS